MLMSSNRNRRAFFSSGIRKFPQVDLSPLTFKIGATQVCYIDTDGTNIKGISNIV